MLKITRKNNIKSGLKIKAYYLDLDSIARCFAPIFKDSPQWLDALIAKTKQEISNLKRQK